MIQNNEVKNVNLDLAQWENLIPLKPFKITLAMVV